MMNVDDSVTDFLLKKTGLNMPRFEQDLDKLIWETPKVANADKQYLSNEAALKSFVVWTMGSLGDVTLGQLGLLLPAVVLGLVLAVAVIKPLNLLLLGENYARTMGLDIRRSRQLIFLSTTLLAGTVTAFCGPIGFIGLAVPHVARILFADADHRILVPASILTGIVVMLLCDVLAKLLTFPINTITALLGIPIVIWVVIRNKSIV